MEFRLLGALEVTEGGVALPLGGPRQRTVLAHLVLNRGRAIPTERFIDLLWSDDPPDTARGSLQAYISRLRRALGDGARIEGAGGVYVLHVDASSVDVERFERLCAEAREHVTTDTTTAVERFDEALGLWRGSEPLADLEAESSLQGAITRLSELRLDAIEDRIAAIQDVGTAVSTIPELEAHVAEHPFRERGWYLLMYALYRADRQVDALEAYQRASAVLVEELGIDPSADLEQLQLRILKQDPGLDLPTRAARSYELLEPIGSGSLGVVHRAIQPGVGREVAIKVIRPELADDPTFIRRFDVEAQLVARLEHPHVVPLHDFWREPGAAYLVMRYLRGGSLQDRLDRDRPEITDAVRIAEQVGSALDAAHRAGVVHRDVKPANILLDEDGNAYVSDFGIAVELDGSDETPLPSSISSPYRSPEEVEGSRATPRSDIYSIGVVLRQLIDDGTEPDADRLEVVSALGDVADRAAAVAPEHRFATAHEFVLALRAAAPGSTSVNVLAAAGASPVAAHRNPYKGLLPFDEADQGDFYGREALVEDLVQRLSQPGSRSLVLIGPSGSGKSSLARAGLLPAARAGRLGGGGDRVVISMSPGSAPFEVLADALRAVSLHVPDDLASRLEADDGALAAMIRSDLAGSDVFLFVDQLEELFTLVDDPTIRAAYVASLVEAVRDLDGTGKLVVTLRADALEPAMQLPGLADLLAGTTVMVGPLDADELERAIVEPASRVGITIGPGLAALASSDVMGRPGSLPLLQYTLAEMVEASGGLALTTDGYRALGGVGGALVGRAEQLYQDAGPAGQRLIRTMLLLLVEPGEDGLDGLRRVARHDLSDAASDAAQADGILDEFARHRLLAFDRDPVTRTPVVEIAHEALTREWHRLRDWIDAAREDMRAHRALVMATDEWLGSDRDESFLLRGARLETTELWAATSTIALTSTARAFLDRSIAARDAEFARESARREHERDLEHRSRRRLRLLAAVLAVGLVAVAALAIFAIDEGARAERQALVAGARSLTIESGRTLETDQQLALLLAIEAADRARAVDGVVPAEIEEALRQAVRGSRVRWTVPGRFGAAFSPDGAHLATSQPDGRVVVHDVRSGDIVGELHGHDDLVLMLEYAGPGGERIVTSSLDGRMGIWDAARLESLGMVDLPASNAWSMTLTPDGRTAAVRTFNGPVFIVDVDSGEVRREIPIPTLGIHFGPDGRSLVLGSDAAVVVDAETGEVIHRLGSGMIDVRFSPDGSLIASSGGDGLVYLWDAMTGEPIGVLEGHRDSVESVDFSPDGSLLASGGSDGTIRVWNVATHRGLEVLTGLGATVDHVTWSPDGGLVVGAGGADRVRIWDIRAGAPAPERGFIAHDGTVYGLDYHPTGRRLASASGDASARIWDLDSGEEAWSYETAGAVLDVDFDATGEYLATAGSQASIWHLGTDARTAELAGETMTGVDFAPDGSRVATSSIRAGHVWGLGSEAYLELSGHETGVTDAVFADDGRIVATAGVDDTIRLWDPSDGATIGILEGHGNVVNRLAVHPSDATLASASSDGTVRVWDLGSRSERHVFTGEGGAAHDVAWSPDGAMLAAVYADGSVRLWDAVAGERSRVVARDEGARTAVAFSPDGRWLVHGGEDGIIWTHALEADDLLEIARSRTMRDLTDDECRRYLDAPCG